MDKVEVLRAKWDALVRAKRDVRQAVKDEFRERIAEEIKARTLELDRGFAIEMNAAKEGGLTRSDIAYAMRSNDHSRMRHYLDLAGGSAFSVGRPKESSLDKLRQQKQFEIVDVALGAVKFYALGKHVFDTPITGTFKWSGGTNYFLTPYEGSDVTEWALALKMIREGGNDAYKSSVLHGTLRDLREELEARGWGKVETTPDDSGMGDFLGWTPGEVPNE